MRSIDWHFVPKGGHYFNGQSGQMIAVPKKTDANEPGNKEVLS
jgi:hypothetical protein